MAKKELTYKQAMQELEKILEKIENEEVDVDRMASLIQRATELIQFCKIRLTKSREEVDKALKILETENKNSK
jgi:exodeoxyribonuclease VII small subunit